MASGVRPAGTLLIKPTTPQQQPICSDTYIVPYFTIICCTKNHPPTANKYAPIHLLFQTIDIFTIDRYQCWHIVNILLIKQTITSSQYAPIHILFHTLPYLTILCHTLLYILCYTLGSIENQYMLGYKCTLSVLHCTM